jgi:hypothetical protein
MRYRLIAASGQVLEEGEGQAGVSSGALVVTPQLGQPLRIRPIDVTAISEPAPYVVLLRLAEGPALELAQLGALRTQVLSDFAAVRTKDTVGALLLGGLGTPVSFPGAVYDVDAELRVYDDVLIAVPVQGDPQQVRFSVEDITTDASGYRITVTATGRKDLEVHRLATRTSEFLTLLRKRVSDARLRSAALLNVLLPGLPSIAARSVAGLLRDGVPAPVAALDAVEPTVSASLLRAATLPARAACVQALAQRGELWLGLHQRESVEVAATGGQDLSAAPVDVHRDHGGVGAAPGGLGGVMTGGLLAGGPDLFGIGAGGPDLGTAVVGSMLLGGLGGFGGLAGGPGGTAPDPHQERHGGRGGSADVAHTDYDRLGTGGDAATVLGMVYAVVPQHHAVVYEVLNDRDHATYVYDLPPGDPADGVRALAAALAMIGFRVSAVYSDASGVDSRFRDAVERLPYLSWLRSGFRGRAIHTDGWAAQLDGLLGAR